MPSRAAIEKKGTSYVYETRGKGGWDIDQNQRSSAVRRSLFPFKEVEGNEKARLFICIVESQSGDEKESKSRVRVEKLESLKAIPDRFPFVSAKMDDGRRRIRIG